MLAFTGNSVSYIHTQYWYLGTIQLNESAVPRLVNYYICIYIYKQTHYYVYIFYICTSMYIL